MEADFEANLKEVREQENEVASKLREQVESLHSEIDKLKNHHFDLESFKNEATSVNQRVMFSKVSLYTFLSSLQDIDIKLMQYEDLSGQQLGEISFIDDVYGKIVDYQKHEIPPEGIKKFSFMEVKSFEVFIGSWKFVVKEAVNMITQSRKACERIWNSSEVMMEIVGLPRLENFSDSIPCMLLTEPVEVDREVKDKEIHGFEQVDMAMVKRWLIEPVKHNSIIEAWISSAEKEFKIDIVRDVCQIGIFLENHRPEYFTNLLEVCDKWDQHFKVKDTSTFEKGESSSVDGVAVGDQLEQVDRETA